MIDPYYYWTSRNRQLVIVITSVFGNIMPTEKKTDCCIDNCPGVVMMRFFVPVIAVLGMERKGLTERQ